jgi:hypothetical protein
MAVVGTAPLIEFLYLTWFTRFSVHVSVLIVSLVCVYVCVCETEIECEENPLPVVIRPSWGSFMCSNG